MQLPKIPLLVYVFIIYAFINVFLFIYLFTS